MARPRLEKPVYRLKRARGGAYHIHWTEHGRTRSASTGSADEAEAKAFLARFVVGRDEPDSPDQPRVREIVCAYVAARIEKVSASSTLAFSAAPIKSLLGDLLPIDISDRTAERYAEQRPVKPGTVIRELGVLRAALHWAERQRWIDRAPKFLMPVAHPEPRDRWLTKDEAAKLLEAAKTPHVRLFILLGLLTGARSGALLDLKWSQVSDATIDFGREHGNKRRAVVPINDRLRLALQEAAEQRTSDYVIEYGGEPILNVKNAFRRTASAAGLPGVTPHVLRHTAATWMAMDGVPMRDIARFLGDTERTIERVYAKHSPDYLRRAARALEF